MLSSFSVVLGNIRDTCISVIPLTITFISDHASHDLFSFSIFIFLFLILRNTHIHIFSVFNSYTFSYLVTLICYYQHLSYHLCILIYLIKPPIIYPVVFYSLVKLLKVVLVLYIFPLCNPRSTLAPMSLYFSV